jgi:hypothetical protein
MNRPILLVLSALLFLPWALLPRAQSPDPQAQALVRQILAQRPGEAFQVQGQVRLRHADRRRTLIPLSYTLLPGEEEWREIYETRAAGLVPAERLVIVHRAGQSNQYLHAQAQADGRFREPVLLEGPEAAIPFASSDYWLSDLGLEFLHWPEQRMAETQIKMRATRPAIAIESINPNPHPNTYARVVSWIDAEHHIILRAEAFDLNRRKFKTFFLSRFRRMADGGWFPRELVMENARTDSETRIELHFDGEATEIGR